MLQGQATDDDLQNTDLLDEMAILRDNSDGDQIQMEREQVEQVISRLAAALWALHVSISSLNHYCCQTWLCGHQQSAVCMSGLSVWLG